MSANNELIKRVIQDIKQDPKKLDEYLQILAKKGLLKGVKTLQLKSCSADLLKELEGSETIIILK